MFSGVGGALMGAGDKLLVLAQRAAPLAKVAGKAAIPLTLATSALSAFTADTFGAASMLKTEAAGLLQEAQVLLGSALGIFDNGLLRTLGGGLLAAGSGAVWALKWTLKGVNAALVPISGAFQMLGIYVERGVEFLVNAIKFRSTDKALAAFNLGLASDLKKLKAMRENRFALGSSGAAQGRAEARPVVQNVTHIGKVEVNQKVEQNASPDRVAWAWNDMLTQLSANPRQAKALPVPRR